MKKKNLLLSLWVSMFLTFMVVGIAGAKSLYVIDGINANPTPVSAYDINPGTGMLTYQATDLIPYAGWGAVGIGAWLEIDPGGTYTGEGTIFVTYESSNIIQLIDAKTMTASGSITVGGASNMAGIVYDTENDLLYTVDRYTDNLYVYKYNPVANTLILQSQHDLPGLSNGYSGGAFGISLDEKNDLLYVGNNTATVRYYNTSDWSQAGSIAVAHTAINVAIDEENGSLYSGGGFVGNYYLDKHDLGTATNSSVYLGSSVGVMGLGVDFDTGYVYCTTGYSGDDLRVYDPSLALVQNVGYIGNGPTGLVIPRGEAGYNPLNLSKDDGGQCVVSGQTVTYDICFDNTQNTQQVNNVTIVDYLPNPSEATFASSTVGIYDPATNTVTWNVGTIPGGIPQQCGQLVLNVHATPGSTFTNTCTITSDDTPPSTKSDTTDVCVGPIQTCDVDGDLDVDIYDIMQFNNHRGSTDPAILVIYDIDGDGVVTTNDARTCVLDCDNPNCAP